MGKIVRLALKAESKVKVPIDKIGRANRQFERMMTRPARYTVTVAGEFPREFATKEEAELYILARRGPVKPAASPVKTNPIAKPGPRRFRVED
jgi:hypothetical protein